MVPPGISAENSGLCHLRVSTKIGTLNLLFESYGPISVSLSQFDTREPSWKF